MLNVLYAWFAANPQQSNHSIQIKENLCFHYITFCQTTSDSTSLQLANVSYYFEAFEHLKKSRYLLLWELLFKSVWLVLFKGGQFTFKSLFSVYSLHMVECLCLEK